MTAAVAVSLLVAGCSGQGKSESAVPEPSVIGTPVGDPVSSPAPATLAEPSISPSPSSDAPLIEKIKHDLRERTLKMAHAPGKTSATCDKDTLDEAEGSTVTCTVMYEGVEVKWPVKITGPSMGGMLLSYEAKPSTGILARDGVIAAFWANHHDSGTDLRCQSMPKAKAVPLNSQTAYRCSYLTKAPVGGQPLWVDMNVNTREIGPYLTA
ncbi:hypothetical protein [Streptomyces syringium]|uniref:hypothetical protein n=1 Tax=Streptomyces syringium TaxID=76729 RepID=UPI00340FC28D